MLEINKLHHGDCMDLMKLMPANSVNMLLTDIPYDEVNKQVMTPFGTRKSEDKGEADALDFVLAEFLEEVYRVCSGSFYIFCGIEQVSEIRKFFRLKGLSNRSCVWEKTNPSPLGGKYMWLSGLEHCIYAKKPKAVFNEHCKRNVWQFSRGSAKVHPTQKSLELFEYLIKTSSNEGDIILDTCAGYSTTLIAAKNLNRRYLGMEKNQIYYDQSIERLKGNK